MLTCVYSHSPYCRHAHQECSWGGGGGGEGEGAEGHLPPPPFIPERQVLEFYLHLNDLLPQIVDLVVLVSHLRRRSN